MNTAIAAKIKANNAMTNDVIPIAVPLALLPIEKQRLKQVQVHAFL